MFSCPFLLVGKSADSEAEATFKLNVCRNVFISNRFQVVMTIKYNKHINGISAGYSGYTTNGTGGLQSYSNGMGHIHLHRSAWHHGTLLTLSQDIFTLCEGHFPEGCPGKWIQIPDVPLDAAMHANLVMHDENT